MKKWISMFGGAALLGFGGAVLAIESPYLPNSAGDQTPQPSFVGNTDVYGTIFLKERAASKDLPEGTWQVGDTDNNSDLYGSIIFPPNPLYARADQTTTEVPGWGDSTGSVLFDIDEFDWLDDDYEYLEF